jgi:hypothetical protein
MKAEDFVHDLTQAFQRNACGAPTVGMPCGLGIGADIYAAIVTYVSPSRKTIRVKSEHGKEVTFRAVGDAYKARHYYVSFGPCGTKLDPHF